MRKKALFILGKDSFKKIYSTKEIERIKGFVDLITEPLTAEDVKKNPKILQECQIIMSGWQGPHIDDDFLKNAPNLEAVFYGAGSIRSTVTPEFWKKNIVITSSWAANAVPVVEVTFAHIILCLKNTYRLNHFYTKKFSNTGQTAIEEAISKGYGITEDKSIYGSFGTTVGLISLGMIGRMTCKMLKQLDVDVLAYDPILNEEKEKKLGVKSATLDKIFQKSHVVSLHTPWIPETEGMINGRHFDMMLPGASFINTARGAIVKEEEMIDVLQRRKDITAVLDVTYPEPPEKESPLFEMENVFLTPHICGSLDSECQRMGMYAVDELERYLSGEQLQHQVTEKMFEKMA